MAPSFEEQLSRVSLGERQRQLNQRVRESAEQDDRKTLEDWANSGSQGERLFLVRRALHHKDLHLLCLVLQSEDTLLVHTALHAKWLYQDHARFLLEHVIPNASHSTICRVIAGLSVHLRNESEAEHCFKVISKKFSQDMALRLLRVCTISFVRELIMQDFFVVPETLLLHLYKRDVVLVLDYLEKFIRDSDKLEMKNSLSRDYRKIWSIMALHHTDIFVRNYETLERFSRFNLSLNVGAKILKMCEDDVVKNPNKFRSILKPRMLMTGLKGEKLENFLLNLMVEKESHFYMSQLSSYIDLIKPTYAVKLLISLYSKKYNGSSIFVRDEFASCKLFQYLPKDTVSSWAREKLKNLKSTNHPEHFILQFIPPAEAIPRLKVLLTITTDATERAVLLERMVECCVFYENTDALLEVLKFTAKRYRNDLALVRYQFLNKLRNSLQLHTLSADHWEVINEMVEFMCVSGEMEKNYWTNFLVNILEQRMHFCLLHNLEIDSIIDKLIEFKSHYVNLLKGVPEFEFVVLNKYFSKYKLLIEADLYSETSVSMVNALVDSYSKRSDCNKHSVTECDWLMDVVRKYFLNEKMYMYSVIRTLQLDAKGKQLFADEIFKSFNDSPSALDFLKHDASVLVRNLDKFLNVSVQEYSIAKFTRLFRIIRTYMMEPLGAAMEQHLRKIMLQDNKEDSRKKALIAVALCLLADMENVESTIKQFIPVQTKVDIKENKLEYTNSSFIAEKLQFMDPAISFNTVLSFAKDDYLKHALPSLLALCFRKKLPESIATISVLLKKPVSVKKHGIRLAYFLLPREDLLALYRTLWDAEKNSSIRDILFQRTFRLLQTENNEERYKEIWNQIKYYFKGFSETNVNLFPYLENVNAVRPVIINDYCETCWSVLKSLDSQALDVDSELCSLSSSFIEFIEFLSEEFCESIIMEYMSAIDNPDDGVSGNLCQFLVTYLVRAKDEELQNKHITHTCEIFKKYISDHWNKAIDGDYKYRTVLSNFIIFCCRQAISAKKEISPARLLKSLLEMLSSVLPFEAVFNYHILLNMTIIYSELMVQDPSLVICANQSSGDSPAVDNWIQTFGQKVAAYFNTLCEQVGTEIGPTFKIEFFNFIDSMVNFNNKDKFRLCVVSGLIEGTATVPCQLLAVDLLKSCNTCKAVQELLERLDSQGNSAVKITVHNKFSTFANLL